MTTINYFFKIGEKIKPVVDVLTNETMPLYKDQVFHYYNNEFQVEHIDQVFLDHNVINVTYTLNEKTALENRPLKEWYGPFRPGDQVIINDQNIGTIHKINDYGLMLLDGSIITWLTKEKITSISAGK